MTYIAVIKDIDFMPMNVIPSELRLKVNIKEFQNSFMLEVESGSIERLSKRFGFEVKGNHYNFTKVYNRKCIVRVIETSPVMRIKFIRYV